MVKRVRIKGNSLKLNVLTDHHYIHKKNRCCRGLVADYEMRTNCSEVVIVMRIFFLQKNLSVSQNKLCGRGFESLQVHNWYREIGY